MVYYIIGIVIALLILTIILVYNKLIRNRNRMEEAWSIVDVYLKKRSDLVPNLVEIVKGYSAHERQLLEEVTRYRTDALRAGDTQAKVASENGLTQALDKLYIIVEKYPDLKANQNYLKLQQQLSEIENDLEKSRRYYNGTVRENNIYQESFPSNIIANLFGFTKGVFFAADAAAKEVPTIAL